MHIILLLIQKDEDTQKYCFVGQRSVRSGHQGESICAERARVLTCSLPMSLWPVWPLTIRMEGKVRSSVVVNVNYHSLTPNCYSSFPILEWTFKYHPFAHGSTDDITRFRNRSTEQLRSLDSSNSSIHCLNHVSMTIVLFLNFLLDVFS